MTAIASSSQQLRPFVALRHVNSPGGRGRGKEIEFEPGRSSNVAFSRRGTWYPSLVNDRFPMEFVRDLDAIVNFTCSKGPYAYACPLCTSATEAQGDSASRRKVNRALSVPWASQALAAATGFRISRTFFRSPESFGHAQRPSPRSNSASLSLRRAAVAEMPISSAREARLIIPS